MREEPGQTVDDPIDGGKFHPAHPASPAKSGAPRTAARRLFYRLAPVRFCDRIASPLRPESKTLTGWLRVLEHTPESPPPGRRAQVSYAAIGARYLDGKAQKPMRLSPFGRNTEGSGPAFI